MGHLKGHSLRRQKYPLSLPGFISYDTHRTCVKGVGWVVDESVREDVLRFIGLLERRDLCGDRPTRHSPSSVSSGGTGGVHER